VKYEEIKGSLRIGKRGAGYDVWHTWSGLAVVQRLRLRRFAEQARTELLATGVDFTQSAQKLQASRVRNQWGPVYLKWRGRGYDMTPGGRGLDPVTFEHYSSDTHYGQLVPSEAQADEMRELADRLRRAKRTPVGQLALDPYINEFVLMGLVLCDDTELVWLGDPA
jgi:hypothetical protein